MIVFSYYIPFLGENISNVTRCHADHSDKLQHMAEKAAAHYHHHRGGWELRQSNWPLDIVILNIDLVELGVVSVDRHMTPLFDGYVK